MGYQKHEYYLRRCIEISQNARNNGNTPFGAILVDECGKILLEQENIEITGKICTGHAEATLAERASHCTARSFFGNAPCILQLNPVLCVPEQYTGQILGEWFLQ